MIRSADLVSLRRIFVLKVEMYIKLFTYLVLKREYEHFS
jgi:hypothetical protein